VLIVVLLSLALIVKLARDFGFADFLLPLDANGTSPNFIIPFTLPLLWLIPRKSITLWEFSKNAFGAAVGMTLYEFIQLMMPWRTFDGYDIVASFLGGFLSILLAWPLFFRRRG
jgi:hypothetical protein